MRNLFPFLLSTIKDLYSNYFCSIFINTKTPQRLAFLSLFFFLVLLSCNKNEKLTPDIIEPEPELEIERVKEIELTNFTGTTLDHGTLLTSMVSKAMTIVSFHPSFHGLQDNTEMATVRACPDYSDNGVTLTSDPSTSPTLESTFSFDDCQVPGATFDHTYDGDIFMEFTGAIGSSSGNGSNQVSSTFTMDIPSPGLVVDNGDTQYTIVTDAPIEFTYLTDIATPPSTSFSYELAGDVTVTDSDGYITTYPGGSPSEIGNMDNNLVMNGVFDIIDQAANDDITDPSTFIDNMFVMSIVETAITCSNGTTEMPICLKTQANSAANNTNTGIGFQLSCGCPSEGIFEIAMATENMDGTVTCGISPNETQFDFGSDAAGTSSETCDNFVENGNGLVMTLDSCN